MSTQAKVKEGAFPSKNHDLFEQNLNSEKCSVINRMMVVASSD